MTTRWLITGGAGYIGAHVAQAFLDSGRQAVVLDDLSSGKEGFVPHGAEFIHGDVVNPNHLDRAIGTGIDGVVHLAGFKYAGVSVQRPLYTYRQNVTGMVELLAALQRHKVTKIVFSSSAAVYGTPDVDIVTEETETHPESPYGESKLIGEWLLRDQARATELAHTSLRYFNVVGTASPRIRDVSPHNLIPLVLGALQEGRTPQIFGDDYATPDGTCVRDYVHVQDVALAHVAAAARLEAGSPIERVYNLGAGTGTSVAEIMQVATEVTGIDFTPEIGPRRPGDPARIVASGALAARDLDWARRYTLTEMIASAWGALTNQA